MKPRTFVNLYWHHEQADEAPTVLADHSEFAPYAVVLSIACDRTVVNLNATTEALPQLTASLHEALQKLQSAVDARAGAS